MAFNKKEYDKNFMQEKRKNLKTFKVDLLISEFEEIDSILKNFKIQKKEFLKISFEKFKEEKKMKKYYINCGTDYYKKLSGKYVFENGVTCEHLEEFIGIYDNYDEAFKIYNSIELKKHIDMRGMYADYKAIYEIDKSIEDEDEVDLDKAVFIADEYSFTE